MNQIKKSVFKWATITTQKIPKLEEVEFWPNSTVKLVSKHVRTQVEIESEEI
jgi:hypothetical protein